MKYLTIFITLFLGFNASGQLIDHYQFQENDKTLNLVERMEQMNTPGMLIYIDAFDFKDSLALGKLGPASNKKLEIDHLFPAGALSFYPVKIEILRLQQEAILDLDDDIKKHLPELQDSRLFKFKEITIRDLLLANVKFNGPYKPSGYNQAEERTSLDELMKTGSKDFPNGIKIKSSKNNSGNLECTYAILCQLLLEKIHQKPLNTIIQENIFQPIGMVNSFYASELSPEKELMASKGSIEGTALAGGYQRYEALASAGLWTTVKDYALLLRHVIDASKGIDNQILSIENARRGIYKQEGFTTLIFHSQTAGQIYGGGSSKGFYTIFEVDIKKDIVQVLFANADVVWPLLNYATGQTASYVERKREDRVLGIYVPTKTDAKVDQQIELVKSIAIKENIPFEIRYAEEGLPKEISGLPALVMESKAGNSLYGGLIGESSSVLNFIRTSSFRAISVKQDRLEDATYLMNGTQKIVIPIKYTGDGDLRQRIAEEIVSCMDALNEPVSLYPTDRKLYLDVHPFYKGDTIFLSYAIFSQFNCIKAIKDNFGDPLIGFKGTETALVENLVRFFKKDVDNYFDQEISGFTLASNPEKMMNKADYLFGPKENLNEDLESTTLETAIAGSWSNLTPLSFGQPLVQFNFPTPLNRYAGEIKKVSGNIELEEGMMSGFFEAELSSLTMGMKDLDAKVLKQYLKVRSNPTASFNFENISIPLNWDVEGRQKIQGEFNFMGKLIPLEVEAKIRPQGRDQSLHVAVDFLLEITDTFGIAGPDGPVEASSYFEFSVNVKMKA